MSTILEEIEGTDLVPVGGMNRTIAAAMLGFLAGVGTASAQPIDPNSRAVLRAIALQRQKLPKGSESATVRALIRSDLADRILPAGLRMGSDFGNVRVVDINVDEWLRLRSLTDPTVIMADEGLEPSEYTPADLAHASELHRGLLNATPLLGSGVLLAIYDSGIDWRNAAFRSDTENGAIAFIWDQTEPRDARCPPPPGRSEGRFYDREALRQACRGERSDVTTSDRTGHGTMVAAAALSIAPGADLVIIKGGDERFSESGLLETLAFLDSLGLAWNRPVVLNLSLGSQRGPHDGSTPQERAIEAFVARPGRFVVAAAGNSGGRGIHAEGMTRSPSDVSFISLEIPKGSDRPGDGLDLEIWFSDTTGIHVEVETPSGRLWTARNAGSAVSVDGEGVMVIDRPAGGRLVTIQLADAAGIDPMPGSYRLKISGGTSFHAWITRSHFASPTARFLADPAVVTERMTVQSPAASFGALAVGATELSGDRFSPAGWSSIGPTADGRPKPEITAPGNCWLGSLGRSGAGTSISAPLVSGAAVLLFELKPQATSGEIANALTRPASTGVGQLDAAAAVAHLLDRPAYSASFISLRRPTAATLTWSGEPLALTDRYALVDHASSTTIAEWTADSGTTRTVVLTDRLGERLNSGRAWLVVADRFGREMGFEIPGWPSMIGERPGIGATPAIGAYPNPFNASTTLTLDLPADGVARVAVYSIEGREVARLHDGPVTSGQHRWPWTSGSASGVYFVRSEYRTAEGGPSGGVATLKLLMLR